MAYQKNFISICTRDPRVADLSPLASENRNENKITSVELPEQSWAKASNEAVAFVWNQYMIYSRC